MPTYLCIVPNTLEDGIKQRPLFVVFRQTSLKKQEKALPRVVALSVVLGRALKGPMTIAKDSGVITGSESILRPTEPRERFRKIGIGRDGHLGNFE